MNCRVLRHRLLSRLCRKFSYHLIYLPALHITNYGTSLAMHVRFRVRSLAV